MKTLSTYKSILFKFILSLTIATISILQSIPADATTINQAEIISKNTFNNSLTIQLNNTNDLYNFYVNDIDNYYLAELITVTMDDRHDIIDGVATSEPQVYNTTISQIQGNTAFLIANGNKYSFENEEGSDGWKTWDKCKVIIQDGRLLEIKPIPLNER